MSSKLVVDANIALHDTPDCVCETYGGTITKNKLELQWIHVVINGNYIKVEREGLDINFDLIRWSSFQRHALSGEVRQLIPKRSKSLVGQVEVAE